MFSMGRSVSKAACFGAGCLTLCLALSSNAGSIDFKTAFSNLLGGRAARLVWISPQNQIWGMDTKDGTARKITSDADLPPGSAKLHDPSMTWDQARVIFTNMQNMSVYSVNWDGTGFKKIATGFFSAYAWQGQNKHWIIVTPKKKSMDANNTVLRMNVDNAADTVLLWNKTSVGAGESFHASLSVDGTRMAENYPHPNMGIAEVPNGTVHFYQPGVEICVPSISRDNQYKALCFNHDHTNFVIMDSVGKEVLNKSFTGSGGLPFSAVNAPSYLRWTTDQNIATVDNYVVRISDLQYVEVAISGAKAMGIDLAVIDNTSILGAAVPVIEKRNALEKFPLIDVLGRSIGNQNIGGDLLIKEKSVLILPWRATPSKAAASTSR